MIATRCPKIIPYKYILYISMLFITVDLSAVAVAYKMVSLNNDSPDLSISLNKAMKEQNGWAFYGFC